MNPIVETPAQSYDKHIGDWIDIGKGTWQIKRHNFDLHCMICHNVIPQGINHLQVTISDTRRRIEFPICAQCANQMSKDVDS